MTEQTAAAKGRTSPERVPAQGEAGHAPAPSARAALGGWLEGPNLHTDDGTYRGERLGLPETGPGSLATQGRRVGALAIDWVIAVLIVEAFGWHPTSSAGSWDVLAVFAAEHLVLLSTLGYTIGKRVFGLRVGKLGSALTPLNVIARTVLLMLVIPPVIWDRDGRGLHDRLSGTVELRR